MRRGALLAATIVLSLSVVSTTFVFLALTSPKWSSQSYFYAENGQSDGSDVNVICIASRSPFYRCGIPAVTEDRNCTIPDCTFYKPYGLNQTSCRSAAEYGVGEDHNV